MSIAIHPAKSFVFFLSAASCVPVIDVSCDLPLSSWYTLKWVALRVAAIHVKKIVIVVVGVGGVIKLPGVQASHHVTCAADSLGDLHATQSAEGRE